MQHQFTRVALILWLLFRPCTEAVRGVLDAPDTIRGVLDAPVEMTTRIGSDGIAVKEHAGNLTSYPKADEYDSAWTDPTNLEAALDTTKKALNAAMKGADWEELVRALIVFAQIAVVTKQEEYVACVDLCAVCMEPGGRGLPQHKTIWIERAKSFKAKALASVNATLGGLVGFSLYFLPSFIRGAALGFLAFFSAASDSVFGTHAFPEYFRGFFASLAKPFLEFGRFAKRGIGRYVGALDSKKLTDCRRVGFQMSNVKNQPYANGVSSGVKKLQTAMGYSKENAQNAKLSKVANSTSPNYKAILHCEHLKSRNFDIRHAVECMRHSELCSNGPALIFPSSKNQCNMRHLEEINDKDITRVVEELKNVAPPDVAALQKQLIAGRTELETALRTILERDEEISKLRRIVGERDAEISQLRGRLQEHEKLANDVAVGNASNAVKAALGG